MAVPPIDFFSGFMQICCHEVLGKKHTKDVKKRKKKFSSLIHSKMQATCFLRGHASKKNLKSVDKIYSGRIYSSKQYCAFFF